METQDPKPLNLRAQYQCDPEELVSSFLEKVKKSWPGYRITDYKFISHRIIEIVLAR